MKRSRFSEVQIIGVLKEHEAGVSVADLCRKHGVSDAKAPPICSTVNFAGRERASCLDPVATNIHASRYRDSAVGRPRVLRGAMCAALRPHSYPSPPPLQFAQRSRSGAREM